MNINQISTYDPLKVISIIGASGFVGSYLLQFLSDRQDTQIRVLVHRRSISYENFPNLIFIEGDLLSLDTLDDLVKPGCTVINLAYLTSNSVQDNLEAMRNLSSICAKNHVKRLIHCSTAVVVGRVNQDVIYENTICHPNSDYEVAKLMIEHALMDSALNRFEISVLRPTAVFGPGGKNLLKLSHELLKSSPMKRYLKSCLFNRRSMNLVCIQNVVAALVFLLDTDQKVDREIFIASDDDSPINNYQDVEDILMKNIETKSYIFPRIPIPSILLNLLLFLNRNSITNPKVKFSDGKLSSLGFKKPIPLEIGLASFANWYKTLPLEQQ